MGRQYSTPKTSVDQKGLHYTQIYYQRLHQYAIKKQKIVNTREIKSLIPFDVIKILPFASTISIQLSYLVDVEGLDSRIRVITIDRKFAKEIYNGEYFPFYSTPDKIMPMGNGIFGCFASTCHTCIKLEFKLWAVVRGKMKQKCLPIELDRG